MALIAKETLTDGWDVVALPGNVVSPEMVEKHGWHNKVDDDGVELAPLTGEDDDAKPAKRSKAPK